MESNQEWLTVFVYAFFKDFNSRIIRIEAAGDVANDTELNARIRTNAQYKEEYERQRQRVGKGISQETFNWWAEKNPYKYIAQCDLFVCSSYREGFSTAATESLIIGTPVLNGKVYLLWLNNLICLKKVEAEVRVT